MNQLRELRQKAKLSQIELAKKLGVSQQTIARWESETIVPPAADVIALARIFRVPIDSILQSVSLDPQSQLLMGQLSNAESSDSHKGYIGLLFRGQMHSVWYPTSEAANDSLWTQMETTKLDTGDEHYWYIFRTLSQRLLLVRNAALASLRVLSAAANAAEGDWEPSLVEKKIEKASWLLARDYFLARTAFGELKENQEKWLTAHGLTEEQLHEILSNVGLINEHGLPSAERHNFRFQYTHVHLMNGRIISAAFDELDLFYLAKSVDEDGNVPWDQWITLDQSQELGRMRFATDEVAMIDIPIHVLQDARSKADAALIKLDEDSTKDSVREEAAHYSANEKNPTSPTKRGRGRPRKTPN